jgi:hypothetical protein
LPGIISPESESCRGFPYALSEIRVEILVMIN